MHHFSPLLIGALITSLLLHGPIRHRLRFSPLLIGAVNSMIICESFRAIGSVSLLVQA
jgi:hypothetical protein